MSDKISDPTQLEDVYQISSQLIATLDLTEMLNLVMDSIIQLTKAESGILLLWDELSGQLKSVAARNIAQETIPSENVKISQTIIQKTVASGLPILTNNAQEDERFSAQSSILDFQLHSIMCAPLKHNNQLVGIAYVDNQYQSGAFTHDHLNQLVTFTHQAATAIVNATNFTKTENALQRRIEELTRFQQIDRELNKTLDLNNLLNLVLKWAITLTSSSQASIGIVETDPDTQQTDLKLAVTHGQAPAHTRLSLDHPTLIRLFSQPTTILGHDLTAEGSISGTPVASQLIVPIHLDNAVSGIIALEQTSSRAYTEEDIAAIERLADRAAVAIKNAQLYEAIKAANDAKSHFVSVVTHELRLPMTSIKGYADLLGMMGVLTEQQTQFLDTIKRNLARMSTLLSDLSDLNYLETGRSQINLKPTIFPEILEDVLLPLKELINKAEQTLIVDLVDPSPTLLADSGRLSQILTNLISNAAKYTPEKGTITISSKELDHTLHITVADTGYGIHPSEQDQIFEQFFRSGEENIRQQIGWGLGLSIVKHLVTIHGGELTFESELNKGSSFTFFIPIVSSNESEQ